MRARVLGLAAAVALLLGGLPTPVPMLAVDTSTASCFPGASGSTTSLTYGAGVTCTASAGTGATFVGWHATGFLPATASSSVTDFHASWPGAATISADFRDASNVAFSVSIAYQVGQPAAYSLPVPYVSQTDKADIKGLTGPQAQIACGPASDTMVLRFWNHQSTSSPTLASVISYATVFPFGWGLGTVAGAIVDRGPSYGGSMLAGSAGASSSTWLQTLGLELAAGHPMVVLIAHPDILPGYKNTKIVGHYVVVTGWNHAAGTIFYKDPGKPTKTSSDLRLDRVQSVSEATFGQAWATSAPTVPIQAFQYVWSEPVPPTPSSIFDGSPGYGTPPATLGGYSMTSFAPDPQDPVAVATVPGPTGDIGLSPALNHTGVPHDWIWWGSNGYAGDVYSTVLLSPSNPTLTITLPAGTRAFSFYAMPGRILPPDVFVFTATANDGTTSGPVSIDGSIGARYFGFYSPTGAPGLSSITLSMADPTGTYSYAVGEFAID